MPVATQVIRSITQNSSLEVILMCWLYSELHTLAGNVIPVILNPDCICTYMIMASLLLQVLVTLFCKYAHNEGVAECVGLIL